MKKSKFFYTKTKNSISLLVVFLFFSGIIFSQKKEETISMKGFSTIPVRTNLKLIQDYKRALSPIQKAKTLEQLAYFHNNTGNLDSLMFYSDLFYLESLNIQKSTPLKNEFLSKSLYLKALETRKRGLIDKAFAYHLKGLEFAKSLKDTSLINLHKFGIGVIYFYKKEYQEALKHYDLCLNNTNDSIFINDIIKRKADILLEKKKLRLAKNKYKEVLSFYKKNGLLKKELEIKLKQGKIQELENNNKKAFKLYNSVREEAEKNQFYDLYFIAQNNIGRLFFMLKEYDNALATLNVAYGNSMVWNNVHYQKEVLNNLRIVYLKTKNYKNAYDVLYIHTNLSNWMLQKQNKKEIKELEIQYKTLEKEKKILELNTQKNLKEKELYRQKNIKKNILIGFILFLIPLLALLYLYYQKLQTQSKLNKIQEEVNNQKITSLIKEQELEIVKANVKGQDEERKRLAQELHDSIGGSLAAIKLQLSNISNDDVSIKNISKQIDDTYNQVRSISHNLIPKKIKDKAFVELIEKYLKNMSTNETSIKFQAYPKQEINHLNDTLKVALFAIIQELLTNAIKHAKASEINIYLNKHGKNINLIFEDNGVGFKKELSNKGIGLLNIENRVKSLLGTVQIDSHPKSGTVIIIDIPFK